MSCPVPAKSGGPCQQATLSRGLCHLHDPDAPFALQHPKYRERLLARPEVQAVLRGQEVTATATEELVSVELSIGPQQRVSPIGSYTAELEHLLTAAGKLLERAGPDPQDDPARWRIRVRRWRDEVAAAREARRARGEGQVSGNHRTADSPG
ncbi:MAG: hypothetical protein EOP01_03850 [Propionibacteriaceae bacterium]|nr:MAG: hypothetical protein EOP01_03850 [Propionibacteriaceae bacterium]